MREHPSTYADTSISPCGEDGLDGKLEDEHERADTNARIRDQAGDAAGPRHHLVVAGTGRAGTSFLVRYLAGLGLDTHLARYGDAAFWDEDANAGLEDLPIADIESKSLPYVVKSPWLHEYVDHLLGYGGIKLDAVVIPIRPLAEAAASRVVLELRALHERAPWMAGLERTWGHWGSAIGGSVFSLHPLDQARVLALGFHRLVEHLVRADVPVVLLDFPRLVLDADYLFGKLAPVLPLPPHVDAARAREIHRGLADAAKVRIGAELAATTAEQAEAGGKDADRAAGGNGTGTEPSLATLDQIAIRRELVRLRGLLAAREIEATSAAAERDQLRAELAAMAADESRMHADRVREESGDNDQP